MQKVLYSANINGVRYKTNPNGLYALYFHKNEWRESATVTNQQVEEALYANLETTSP